MKYWQNPLHYSLAMIHLRVEGSPNRHVCCCWYCHQNYVCVAVRSHNNHPMCKQELTGTNGGGMSRCGIFFLSSSISSLTFCFIASSCNQGWLIASSIVIRSLGSSVNNLCIKSIAGGERTSDLNTFDARLPVLAIIIYYWKLLF